MEQTVEKMVKIIFPILLSDFLNLPSVTEMYSHNNKSNSYYATKLFSIFDQWHD